MHDNQKNETVTAERAKKLNELLTEVNHVEAKLKSLEQNMTAIRNGMSVILLNLRKRANGDQTY